MNTLPIFYSKPKILCIDDDLTINNALHDLLNKFYSTKVFNNSNDLLDYLKNYKSFFEQKQFIKNFTESEYADNPNTLLVTFNIDSLSDIINDTNIQDEIGIVLIDYLMPELDGISLCKQLINHQFKKILYTGSGDYKIGLTAVRDGIIDDFIEKSEPTDILVNKIEEIAFKYYDDKTILLKQNIESEKILPLSDKLFVNYFLKIFREQNIVKYCLIDKIGSIAMTNNKGEKSLLIVHTEQSIQQFLQLIYNESEFKDIYNSVSTKQKIPFLNNHGNNINLELESVQLYKPELLIGKETYYLHQLIINKDNHEL